MTFRINNAFHITHQVVFKLQSLCQFTITKQSTQSIHDKVHVKDRLHLLVTVSDRFGGSISD